LRIIKGFFAVKAAFLYPAGADRVSRRILKAVQLPLPHRADAQSALHTAALMGVEPILKFHFALDGRVEI
jgi:hypothetical protein